MRLLLVQPKPELAIALAREPGIQVTMLAAQPTSPEVEAHGVRVLPCSNGRKISPSAVAMVRRAIQATKPDLVHAFYARALSHTLLAVAGWRSRPRIVSFRGITQHLSWFNPGDWISYRHPSVDFHACESEAVRESMIESGIPAERCYVTYNSMLSPPHEHPGRRGLLQFDIPEKAFVVGTIANMRAVKGVDILLRSAMRVADLDIYWLLMGNVHDPFVRKLAGDPRIRDRVRLVGFRPRASELISGANLFVMPSRAEALCQALLEAMYQGVCPIVSDAGGMKEVVRHEQDGLVVPRENPAALADAIRSLYHDRTRLSQFAVSSRQRVLENFSVEMLADRILHMYRRELSGKATVDSRAAA